MTRSFDKELLMQEYQELGSLRKISAKYYIDRKTILKLCKLYNIEVSHVKGAKYKYSYNEDFFTQETEEVFYLAGFIAADGCVTDLDNKGRSRMLIINLQTGDTDHLEKIKKLLNSDHPIKDHRIHREINKYNLNPTWMSSFRVCISEKFFNDLAKFNIIPHKSLTYTWPEWLKNHPMKHHFIRGYNDGDGCFSMQKSKQLIFSLVGAKSFLLDIHKSFEEECIGIKTNKKLIPYKNIYALKYCGNGIVGKISKYLYEDATIYLDRKKNTINHLL